MALESKPTIKNIWAKSGVRVEPSDAKADTGWIVERPPYQFQNFLQWRSDKFLKHINEAGIPVWDSTTVYTAGKSYVQGSDGLIYKAVTDGAGQNPVGNPSNWVKTFGDLDVQMYADAAAASAADASDSAAAAAASESSAAGSATTATNAATSATNSASAASTSASNANTSATNAGNSATAANTSATNAAASENKAMQWAIKTDGPVDGGEYSAKYWAQTIAGGPVTSWVSLTGVITYAQARTALNITNVDNTSDANKPVSTAQALAIGAKSDTATTVTKDSSTGAANLPVGTTGQRPASPAAGMFRFNSTLFRFEGYQGSSWGSLGGATGGGSDAAFYLNDTTINNDYTIPTGQNAMTAGPVTIAAGKTVTVPAGSTWSII